MKIRNRPLLTETYDDLQTFIPAADSAYIFGTSFEERSAHSPGWEARSSNVDFIRIIGQGDYEFTADIRGNSVTVPLRSNRGLQNFLAQLSGRQHIYIDITGLEHQIWAPLIRAAIDASLQTLVVYVEPRDYRFKAAPREGDIFDLSEQIKGISPLPGFTSLNDPVTADVRFIALLGFEGGRFRFVFEQMQPDGNKVIPIVGLPGFRPEYPFYAYDGNRPVLEETSAWIRVRYAKANCPFSLWFALDDLASDYPSDLMRIAMIGTKPHAVGAILFYITSSRAVELVYDHPIRKERRTEGASRALVYPISAFIRQV